MALLNTPGAAEAWRPNQYAFDSSDVLPDALITTHTRVVGQLEGDAPSIRVAHIVDDDAEFVAEGAPISESDPSLSEVVIYSAKIAQLVRITNEQYRQVGTEQELANSVSRALTRKADAALLTQPAPVAPAPGDPVPVSPVAGLIHLAQNSETVSDNLDGLIDLEAAVRAAGANPTAWLLAPATWAEIRKLKNADTSNVNLLGAGTSDTEPRLLGIPVTVNPAISAGKGLLVDASTILTAVGPVNIAVDEGTYFTTDSTAIRATWRTGHAVPRPDRLGVFTLS